MLGHILQNLKWHNYIRHGYEVPRMILLQAYPYTYSLLRGVTFKVLPLSSYARSLMMPPMLENICVNTCCGIVLCTIITFLWMSSISWNSVPLRQTIFGNSQNPFRAKSREQGGCSISVIDFWARICWTENTLWGGSLSWWRIQSLGRSSSFFYAQLQVTATVFPHNNPGRLFGLSEWIQSEQYPWHQR